MAPPVLLRLLEVSDDSGLCISSIAFVSRYRAAQRLAGVQEILNFQSRFAFTRFCTVSWRCATSDYSSTPVPWSHCSPLVPPLYVTQFIVQGDVQK